MNPFKLNSNQLDCFFYVLRGVGRIFSHFYFNLNITFCKQTVETLVRRCVLWRLIFVSTVCICRTPRTLGLYGLMLRLNSVVLQSTYTSMYGEVIQNTFSLLSVFVLSTQLDFKMLQSSRVLKY